MAGVVISRCTSSSVPSEGRRATRRFARRQRRSKGVRDPMPLDVCAYDAYRPSYPVAALDVLAEIGALHRPSLVADVGSGTGIFTELLLARGFRVVGVEPLVELSAVAGERLAQFSGFTNIAGSAENTTLDDHSVGVVTAASALHWFELDAARAEFGRILREPGWVVALWNFRTAGVSGFGVAFDRLWRAVFGPPPAARREEIEDAIVPEFFGGKAFERYSFANPLLCDEDHLVGLAASSSHAPPRDDPAWRVVEQWMRHLHRAHEWNGVVQVPYETVMYCGRL
ncbi:MAG: methyltransferase domain-containing protein [Pseudonocardiaceae bacterium]|nr:methyltransferase domain-containing protein [Pseudonocardiaceae bacterium]